MPNLKLENVLNMGLQIDKMFLLLAQKYLMDLHITYWIIQGRLNQTI